MAFPISCKLSLAAFLRSGALFMGRMQLLVALQFIGAIRNHNVGVFVFAHVVLLWTSTPFVFGDDLLERRTLTEAPKAWSAWKTFAYQCRFVAKDVYDRSGAKREPTEYEYRFDGGANWCRFEIDLLPAAEQRAECMNPDYGFSVAKTNSTAKWELRDFGHPDRGRSLIEKWQIVEAGYMIFLQSLPEMMKRSSFKVNYVKKLNGQKEGQIRLDFKCREYDRYHLLGGWVDLDPNRSWAITEFKLSLEFPDGLTTVHGTNEYSGQINGFPIPIRHTMEMRDKPDEPAQVRRNLIFSNYGLGTISEDECRLSAFGLPEPAPSGQGRPFMILLNVVLVIIFLAASIYARKKARSGSGGV